MWVAEASGKVVAAVTLTFAGQPAVQRDRDRKRARVPDARRRSCCSGQRDRRCCCPSGQLIMRSRCWISERSASRVRRSWIGHITSTNLWASNQFRVVTGMCRARTYFSGCSGWSFRNPACRRRGRRGFPCQGNRRLLIPPDWMGGASHETRSLCYQKATFIRV